MAKIGGDGVDLLIPKSGHNERLIWRDVNRLSCYDAVSVVKQAYRVLSLGLVLGKEIAPDFTSDLIEG